MTERHAIRTPVVQKAARRNVPGFDEDPESVKLDFKKRNTHVARNRKNWSDLKADLSGTLTDNFDFEVKSRNASLGYYNKSLADMLINGNLRIKFIPKCSTRAGARLYCQSKIDSDGYPRYKLIGTNATDAFGNKICDMNGDQVDDIIICNRDGIPAIINGYKLVHASPYKNIWKNMKASGKTSDTFENWLSKEFDAKKDWVKITEEQWREGKTGWTLDKAPKAAQDAYNLYAMKGLGKPKINTRISPNSAWASLFAKYIWKDVVYAFCQNDLHYKLAMKTVDYLKLANAMYIKYIELPAAIEADNGNISNWIEWTNYKLNNPKLVREALGKRVQEIYRYMVENAETQEQRNQLVDNKDGFYYDIYNNAVETLVSCLGGDKFIQELGASIQAGETDAQYLKECKEDFRNAINKYIDSFFHGYGQYIIQKSKAKVKPNKDFSKYALMRWKNDDNDDGWDFDDDGDNTQF